MSEQPPPNPPQPPYGSTPPPEPPPGQGGQYGQYGGAPQQPSYGGAPQPGYGSAPQQGYGGAPTAPGSRPGELLDRFLARLIDGFAVGIVVVIINAILGAILISDARLNLETGELDGGSTVLYSIIATLIQVAIILGYYSFLESSRGQTLGKMAMKLRVVGPNGGNPTLVQALKRNIWLAASLLGIFGTALSLVGSLVALGAIILIVVGISQDKTRRQHFFDHFAGETRVEKIG